MKKFNKEKYKKEVLERFKKNFTSQGRVFMEFAVLPQLKDGTLSDSKLTKEEYLSIYQEASQWKADNEFKTSQREANRRIKEQQEEEELENEA